MTDDDRIPIPDLPRGAEALLDSPYAEYLGVDTLYKVQAGEFDNIDIHHPEELVFRTVHMVSELWLRLASAELERAAGAMSADVLGAVRLGQRATIVLEQVIDATRLLATMPASEYHQFRIYLGDASGLQSPGYAYLRQSAKTAAGALDELVGDDDQLFDLYQNQRDDPRYALCETLLELDATIDRFRGQHLQIARRFLGELTAGTGGQGIPFLRNNVGQTYFPRLWELRTRIAEAHGAKSYGYGEGDTR